jgi:broad specificity phosphatase PhoE
MRTLSSSKMLTLEIFIHTDAIDRQQWQGPPDDRPLTDLGRRQAERIAEELGAQPVQAIYSSQALRCRDSLEPLARRLGLPIRILPGFQDTAESAFAALQEIRTGVPDGRAVLCSYGDVVPALLAYLAAAWGVSVPLRDNRKGAVFTLRFDGASGVLESRGPTPDFPE